MRRSINPVRIFSAVPGYSYGIHLLLFLLVVPVINEASTNKQSKQNNWFISGSTGIAFRSKEISENVRFTADGFQHQPGFAFDFNVGRTLGQQWEAAFRWGAYTLFGQSELPHYSAMGYYAAYPDLVDQKPLEYITQSNALSFILRFHFTGRGGNGNLSANIRPFMEAGLGINNFTTEVRYGKLPVFENSTLIYRERNGEKADGGAQIVSGIGLKIGEKGEWNGVILLNAEWVEFSRLNALHHFINREKSSAGAIVSRITAGITIPIRRTVKSDNYLPFRW